MLHHCFHSSAIPCWCASRLQGGVPPEFLSGSGVRAPCNPCSLTADLPCSPSLSVPLTSLLFLISKSNLLHHALQQGHWLNISPL
jgi:hypothetical protein